MEKHDETIDIGTIKESPNDFYVEDLDGSLDSYEAGLSLDDFNKKYELLGIEYNQAGFELIELTANPAIKAKLDDMIPNQQIRRAGEITVVTISTHLYRGPIFVRDR